MASGSADMEILKQLQKRHEKTKQTTKQQQQTNQELINKTNELIKIYQLKI